MSKKLGIGLGLGIVSIHTIELELEAGRLVLLDAQSFPIVRHWYIVHRQGKRHSPVARAFMDFVLQEARHYAPDHGEAMAREKRRGR